MTVVYFRGVQNVTKFLTHFEKYMPHNNVSDKN